MWSFFCRRRFAGEFGGHLRSFARGGKCLWDDCVRMSGGCLRMDHLFTVSHNLNPCLSLASSTSLSYVSYLPVLPVPLQWNYRYSTVTKSLRNHCCLLWTHFLFWHLQNMTWISFSTSPGSRWRRKCSRMHCRCWQTIHSSHKCAYLYYWMVELVVFWYLRKAERRSVATRYY